MRDYTCWYGSERKSNKDQRRLAKDALRRGVEPEPEYRTGKLWDD